MTAGNDFFCCALRNFTQLIGTGDSEMECNMRSLNTKLVLTALGILTIVAPAFAQEPHHHHRHSSLTSVPVGQSGRNIYNMVITPDPSQRGNIYNMVINPLDDPAETGGGSVGYNELERTDEGGGN